MYGLWIDKYMIPYMRTEVKRINAIEEERAKRYVKQLNKCLTIIDQILGNTSI